MRSIDQIIASALVIGVAVYKYFSKREYPKYSYKWIERNYSVGLRNPQIQHKVENWKGTEKNSEMSIYKKGKRWYAEEKEWW